MVWFACGLIGDVGSLIGLVVFWVVCGCCGLVACRFCLALVLIGCLRWFADLVFGWFGLIAWWVLAGFVC